MGEQSQPSRLLRTPKEGERILAPTRRPDGTLRKAIRIRAGYVPQDEVAIYQSKGALLKKEAQLEVPPGYDPAVHAKPKTKSAKRNEKRKEKKQQAALALAENKGNDLDSDQAEVIKSADGPSELIPHTGEEHVESVVGKMDSLTISTASVASSTSTNVDDGCGPGTSGPDIDKKIRALKKKIRLAEAQLQSNQQITKPEQLEKTAKIEGWREELKLLEEKKTVLVS
ncbi:hypothetical protein J5N97_018014 [Dioscorea zingiberensis]|uniref:WIBG Mago-binding domain-containing protein n=1 Tax=Dioscorea zingiberensis TaxID=325984 RepID=A0A9D5CN23_9LILI|nr:hypothetical protein J5N97_018014 [Dioscorea zingiberensis]